MTLREKFMQTVMEPEQAVMILAMFGDKVECKLGGKRHCARFVSTKASSEATPWESAEQYLLESPADTFCFNVTIMGTRGRAKNPVPDRMYSAFYTKAQVLQGFAKRGSALDVHTGCIVLYDVALQDMFTTFGLPVCAIECPWALKDIPAAANPRRSQTPYAATWENNTSSVLHANNVANLNGSRYDVRIVIHD